MLDMILCISKAVESYSAIASSPGKLTGFPNPESPNPNPLKTLDLKTLGPGLRV